MLQTQASTLTLARFWLASYLCSAIVIGIGAALIPSLAGLGTAKLMRANEQQGLRGYLWPTIVALLLASAIRGGS